MGPRYPYVVVSLSDYTGSVEAAVGAVCSALWRAGVDEREVGDFVAEAVGGGADLPAVIARWVSVASRAPVRAEAAPWPAPRAAVPGPA